MPQMSLRSGEVFDVGDVPVLFRATDAVRASALRRFVSGFSPATAHATVTVRARRPAVPSREADYAVDDFAVWADGAAMHADLGPDGRASATASSAVIGLTAEGAARSLPSALLIVLTHLLAHRDRFLLHAGAIARDGGAYVVAGPSGAGKSTLVAAALESGWQALADDMAIVRVDDAGLAVDGIRRPVAVPGDLGSALGDAPLSDDPRGRRIVPAAALEAGWFRAAGLIAVGHGIGPAGGLSDLGGVDALRLVRHSFTSTGNAALFRRFLAPAATLARLPGWRLDHGADATTRLAAARRLLADVLAATPARS
jgi:hypothetical protein